MTARFFCSEISSDAATLDETESHHAIHVMRLSVGDAVELFDGSGLVASGSVSAVSRRSVDVQIAQRHSVGPHARKRLIVAAAPPKGDRLKSMIEQLTEIGVDEFVPLKTVRSVVDPGQSRLEKLRNTMIGAMKQSGRNTFLTINPVTDFSAVLRRAASESLTIRLAHPGPVTDTDLVAADRDLLLLIGPEGGFTSEEILRATDHGAVRLAWPDGILRIGTAAVVFSAVLLNQLNKK